MSLFTAGILIIGDEILSGRTQDTNANFIARNLTSSGIKLEEIRVIQDSKKIIIDSVKLFSKKYNYVFTTGGIGPTHDDITSESLAEAFNKTYEINSEAYNILEKYYPEGEFNISRQKMAKMPSDVELIYNPMTAAPGFKVSNVFVLPGVPKIMEQMLQDVLLKLKKGVFTLRKFCAENCKPIIVQLCFKYVYKILDFIMSVLGLTLAVLRIFW